MQSHLTLARAKNTSLGRGLAMLAVLGLVCSALFPGCAALEKDNRRLTNALTENFVPEDNMPLLLATSPLWGTAGIVTLVADTFVLNPIFNARDALDDAIDWAFLGFPIALPVEIVLIAPRAVVLPVVFLASEVLRCSIPYLF